MIFLPAMSRTLAISLFCKGLARKITQLLALVVFPAICPVATGTTALLVESLAENLFLRAIVTAYSSSPDETEGDPFITASGQVVRKGIVACSREFPFGTRFLISGEVYECLDRLAPKYNDRIDIWMPTKEEALEYGRKELGVEILAESGSQSEG
ncbi:MAG: 3D domain-containing protein [Acidobacteria bacterium]|nr:3D domain-containing protein [Acidobacteriota bacterium]